MSGGEQVVRVVPRVVLDMDLEEAALLVQLHRLGPEAASPEAREAGVHLLAALEAAMTEGALPNV